MSADWLAHEQGGDKLYSQKETKWLLEVFSALVGQLVRVSYWPLHRQTWWMFTSASVNNYLFKSKKRRTVF